MGKEIAIAISWNGYFWVIFGFGVASGIVAFVKLFDNLYRGEKLKKTFRISFLVFVLLCGIAIWQLFIVDPPANHERALRKLQLIEETYKTHAFYLKESVCEPGIQGEIKGSFSGFLVVRGSIYGKIDSGRVMTVVYEDNDSSIDHYIGVHKSTSFPLDEAVIITISAGEQPYLMYPEVYIVKDQKIPGSIHGLLRLVPRTPHLYLPEGWEIL